MVQDMVALASEYLTMAQAAALFPGRPCVRVVRRWHTHGCGNARLSAVRVGRKLMCTREDIAEFLMKLNTPGERPAPQAERCGIVGATNREAKEAKAALDTLLSTDKPQLQQATAVH